MYGWESFHCSPNVTERNGILFMMIHIHTYKLKIASF